jgi:hypothetical protein
LRTALAGLLVLAGPFLASPADAQGESGFLRGQGKLDLWFSYYEDLFTESFGIPPVTFEFDVKRASFGVYAAYGLTDDIDLVASASRGTAEFVDFAVVPDEQDWQDLELYTKWRLRSWRVGEGEFSLLAEPGIKVPLANYENQSFVSLGAGQTDYRLRAIGHYVPDDGRWFGSLEFGYDIRSSTPDDELPFNLKLGRRVVGGAWLMPFYTRIEGLGSPPEGVGGFTGGDGFERYGLEAYIPLHERFGIGADYHVSDDGRPTGSIPGWKVGFLVRF